MDDAQRPPAGEPAGEQVAGGTTGHDDTPTDDSDELWADIDALVFLDTQRARWRRLAEHGRLFPRLDDGAGEDDSVDDVARALLAGLSPYGPEAQAARRQFVRDRLAAAADHLDGIGDVDDPDELAARAGAAAHELRQAEREILQAWLGWP